MKRQRRNLYQSARLIAVLCFVSFLGLHTSGIAQQTSVQITGVVLDSGDKQPVPGASIIVKGTTNGTITGPDGSFSLSAPSTSTLIVTFIGYKSQEVQVAGRTHLNIELDDELMQLSDVVVMYAFGLPRIVKVRKIPKPEGRPRVVKCSKV
ncbi:carboxypeptidase-like regulatory domain-containing protein [Alkaliflexus imshenetskii]|uniref:carboxypeptidase-like regulatory domain-containing protein n=1 Tax=Alkaliflexus imshenetskii TaxID=286730 RepID=UPI00047D6EF2|nr:carboxypeptidase-like regulatory domain-containing protein [Alkaliflexus imshenetskii]